MEFVASMLDREINSHLGKISVVLDNVGLDNAVIQLEILVG